MEKECMVCMSSIDDNDIVYYSLDNINWLEHTFCYNCVKQLILNSWNRYVNNIKKADCEKSLKTCLENGLINRITLDGTITSSVIIKIKNNDNIYETKLTDSLSDEELDKINCELKDCLNKIFQKSDYDYMDEINQIFVKYDL
jgi:hypothetical protein